MKKLFQDVNSGETLITDVPKPQCKRGHLLIKSSLSLISAGTERMLVDFGKSNYIDKARKQPEKVKMVMDKVKTDGFLATYDAVKSKLDQPLPMGYSNVGIVLEVGEGVTQFEVGDRVLSNGSHSEIVCVPENLVANIPDDVSDEDAVFTVLGSIALQGVRLAEPTIGERFVVMGLGLIGLLTVQILKANGCKVLGLDFDQEKVSLAESFGAEGILLGSQESDPLLSAEYFSSGMGVDGVIITASTDSNQPMHDAASMCRKNGRIILVGVVGLDIQRSYFYEKEITFRVSCSYGPGRYDPSYEEGGIDYPFGYVRWTEKRNFEAVLNLLSSKSIIVDELKSCEYKFSDAGLAYEKLLEDPSILGITLFYDKKVNESESLALPTSKLRQDHIYDPKTPILGFIGAGNHAGRTLIPGFSKTRAQLKLISSSQGVSGKHYGSKFGFESTTTDTQLIFDDKDINAVVIATQHDSHSSFVLSALEKNKSVFVEKPLAINIHEIDKIEKVHKKAFEKNQNLKLMVGFNRRFSPLIKRLKSSINKSEPLSIIFTCNAGSIPGDSWVQDALKGGGRIIGEACHFIDLSRYLADSRIISVQSNFMHNQNNFNDIASINLSFENGSIATIHYFSNGSKSFPKERLEVFQSGGIACIDNFISLRSYNFSGLKNKRLFAQDKGIEQCAYEFVESICEGSETPIPIEEILEVSKASIQASIQIKES